MHAECNIETLHACKTQSTIMHNIIRRVMSCCGIPPTDVGLSTFGSFLGRHCTHSLSSPTFRDDCGVFLLNHICSRDTCACSSISSHIPERQLWDVLLCYHLPQGQGWMFSLSTHSQHICTDVGGVLPNIVASTNVDDVLFHHINSRGTCGRSSLTSYAQQEPMWMFFIKARKLSNVCWAGRWMCPV